ncbi:MAG TPA: hypothetical protein VLB12_15025 [Gemmatimonadales bacterium]|nr:hypothetical protein [Gemmatimonadales bacterium]
MTSALDDLAVARRFVERLATLPNEFRQPVLPPLLDVDPYLSAWSNVEAALGNAPEPERQRRLKLAAELDRRIREIDLAPAVRSAAGRASRALLARPWLMPPESFKFVYEPFQVSIPPQSL